jgi:hypothetical protein
MVLVVLACMFVLFDARADDTAAGSDKIGAMIDSLNIGSEIVKRPGDGKILRITLLNSGDQAVIINTLSLRAPIIEAIIFPEKTNKSPVSVRVNLDHDLKVRGLLDKVPVDLESLMKLNLPPHGSIVLDFDLKEVIAALKVSLNKFGGQLSYINLDASMQKEGDFKMRVCFDDIIKNFNKNKGVRGGISSMWFAPVM